DQIAPRHTVVEQAEISGEPGQGEVERQEERAHQILDLLGDLDSKAAFVWTDEAREEGAEDGVHADGPGEEGTAKTLGYRLSVHGLAS
ncbi:hypothetical protein LTR53_019500, partial [Teratosphaeriaceae sp. CCFEE 6253]